MVSGMNSNGFAKIIDYCYFNRNFLFVLPIVARPSISLDAKPPEGEWEFQDCSCK